MMQKDEILESGLLEQYVLGLTDDAENQMVLQAIQQYPDLRKHLEEIEKTMENIAQKHAIIPPAELKEKTLQRIANTEKLSYRSARNRTVLEVLGGTTILILSALVFYLYGQLNKTEESLQNQQLALTSLEKSCADKDLEHLANSRLLSLYENEEYTQHVLAASGDKAQGRVVVFWKDAEGEAHLYNQSMTPPPAGKTYQIWADIDQVMVPMGIFKEGMTTIQCKKGATSLNITIEPEGGSEHPDVSNLVASIQV